ncbi:sensor histidine kinase [Vibrio spartinae]|uniref:histidine kinase n=1 Tax=Vibrio spartinae TaxID=1918945 RepID=A0A1N6M554_9VIBR|nr:ATP-binding protein [Vibrio spartinae]SIO94583.1 Sensor protein FixL [Vibrio spartinae]
MLDTSIQTVQRRLMLVASVTPTCLMLLIMAVHGYSGYLIALTAFLSALLIMYCLVTVDHSLNFHLATVMNLVESLTNNEFSMRGKRTGRNDSMDGLIGMINRLSESMNQQRLEIRQQQYLVKKIINNIDVAIFAINDQEEIAFVNKGAGQLFDREPKSMPGQLINSLAIHDLLQCASGDVIEWHFPQKSGQFQINQDSYYENSRRQTLLFVTDVSELLRGQEHRAWKNLLRVLSHEINNTLTPIASLSQILRELLPQEKDESIMEVDGGLKIIEERAKNLKSFIESYRKLTQLPAPMKRLQNINMLLRELLPLFEHRKINIACCQETLKINIDPVQIQQLLINVFKNADEAMTDPKGTITVSCEVQKHNLILEILDQGTGITNKSNLFVPFYSTKSHGNGIGLTLCRQIAENHSGYFSIDNREDMQGCVARLILPI